LILLLGYFSEAPEAVKVVPDKLRESQIEIEELLY
jgi:hypothetical protein